MQRWKEVVKLMALLPLLQNLAVRAALRCWKRETDVRAALEVAGNHSSRTLVCKVGQSRRNPMLNFDLRSNELSTSEYSRIRDSCSIFDTPCKTVD